MSIVTGRGDDGHTDLLFGKRAAKTDARIEAIGSVDELNAAIGMVRAASAGAPDLDAILDHLQEKLVGLMGELAVLPEDASRYAESAHPVISSDAIDDLAERARSIEAEGISFDGWARPGARGNETGARLDVARTVCRRAERRVLALGDAISNEALPLFLNRASDLLWLLARKSER